MSTMQYWVEEREGKQVVKIYVQNHYVNIF